MVPVFLLLLTLHFATAAENIALNKQSWQSSVYPSQTNVLSSRAFDGNTNPDWFNGSCTHTNSEENPWLAVDLQYSRFIYRVDLTNRGDCCSERLANIRIGTSDTSPETQAPALTNVEVCHSYEGPVATGVTQGFYCGSTGRYLIIILEGNPMALTVCEMEAFEKRSTMNLKPRSGQRLAGHSLSSSLIQGISVQRCGQRCLIHSECSSFNYQPTTRSCDLISSTFDEEATSLVADAEWMWYGRRRLY